MARKKRGQPVHGWCVIDKPLGMTSTKAVSHVRRLFDAQKAGHAGTLDPLASGVLPIALGEATKTVPFAMDGAKSYEFSVSWGRETSTHDIEGETTHTSDLRPDEAAIREALDAFTGTIWQVPPKFSAIKVDGERAYDLARDGEDFSLPARQVRIDRLALVDTPDEGTARFVVDCGKGTYIRALARDLGRKLGCFGHISALRRSFVKPFGAEAMIMLETLQNLSHKGADREALLARLLPIDAVLDDIPAVLVDQGQAALLRQGQAIILRGGNDLNNHDMALARCKGKPVALTMVEKGMLKPKRVFNLNQNPSN